MKSLFALPVLTLISQLTLAETPTAFASGFNPEAGKALWYQDFDGRSCTNCHGQSPSDTGKHNKTGRPIEPMALSVNPQRFTDTAKTEKWFRRNCRWTLGRECSPQEKGDILTWLKQQ